MNLKHSCCHCYHCYRFYFADSDHVVLSHCAGDMGWCVSHVSRSCACRRALLPPLLSQSDQGEDRAQPKEAAAARGRQEEGSQGQGTPATSSFAL